eukprot:symbB.v1.2.005091.t1/scaffold234.1/size257806/10
MAQAQEESLDIVLEPSEGHGDPVNLQLVAGGSAATLGRGPKNVLAINLPGISNTHVELRLLKPPSGGQVSAAHLRIKDLSSNGTGLCGPKSIKEAAKLKKDTDTPLIDGSVIVLPLRSKVKSPDSQARVTLRVVEKEAEKPKEVVKESKKKGEKNVAPEEKKPKEVAAAKKTKEVAKDPKEEKKEAKDSKVKDSKKDKKEKEKEKEKEKSKDKEKEKTKEKKEDKKEEKDICALCA